MNFIMMTVLYLTLFISPMMLISSSNIVMMWLSLELSTFSFLPMIISSAQSSFSAAKYFFVQSIGSVMILISLFSSSSFLVTLFFMLALMMKMGMVPFHFWLPKLVSSLQSKEILLLLVWQKIGPLYVFVFIPSIQIFEKMFIGVLSAGIGSILGLKQTQWQQIFTFSSISHLGWLVISSSVSFWLFFVYFFVYAISLVQVFIFMPSKILNSSIFSFSSMNLMNLMMILSLAGLPPMLGFLTKMLVLFYLMTSPIMMGISLILISFSIVSMFFYLKIFFSLTLSYTNFELMRSKTFILSNLILFFAFPLMLNF